MSEAVGVILAAIIVGWVALFSLIVSKEQTVSEFRQRWIDELRKDTAGLVANASGIHGDPIAKRDDQKPLRQGVKPEVTRFNETTARIRLRLNPAEKRPKEDQATQAVLDALKELESIFSSPESPLYRIPATVTTVVTEAQIILEENWRRVRSAEPVYRITKWATLGRRRHSTRCMAASRIQGDLRQRSGGVTQMGGCGGGRSDWKSSVAPSMSGFEESEDMAD